MSEENSFNVIFGNKTDVGKVRQRNEDYMECFKSSFGEVFIVCDGMGGHEGGEIASRLAVATIRQIITANPNGLTSPASIIEEAVSLANKAIISKSEETNGLKGMGTTCVVLIVRGDQAFYGHVGDSRIYLVRGSHLYLMTRDHSFVQGLVDQGLISWEEAESHPRKNEITQAIGIFEKVNPEVNHYPLQLYKGDKFILCSDGLSGPVPEDILLDTVLKYHPVEASNKLIETANSNGGPDNITVQIIEIINAEQLPSDKLSLPPEGSINRSSINIQRNSVIKEFNYENPEKFNLSRKKRSIIPYVAVGFCVLAIVILIIFNPFGTKNNSSNTNKIIDSTKVKDSIQSTKNQVIRKEIETSLRELYGGKSTYMPANLKLSNPFEYQGILGDSVKQFDRVGLVMNIKKNDLQFVNIGEVKNEDSVNFSTDMVIKYEEKLYTFKVHFRTKDSKIFELNSIKYLKQPPIEKVKDKKETDKKKTEKKPDEKKPEQEKTDPVKPNDELKPKEKPIEQNKTNENEIKQENFGK